MSSSFPSAVDERVLLEIAFAGVCYGLTGQARDIFAYCHQIPKSRALSEAGLALTALAEGQPRQAIAILESLSPKDRQQTPLCAVFLAWAYKKANVMETHSQRLLAEVQAHEDPALSGLATHIADL